jgi:hypothetical protein
MFPIEEHGTEGMSESIVRAGGFAVARFGAV